MEIDAALVRVRFFRFPRKFFQAARRKRFVPIAPSSKPESPQTLQPLRRRPYSEALEEIMSTIPLTLIEGAVAMPRVRPLRYVPTSFGRDWALLPPSRNWKAELKALYAAVLHTFCLTDQAILSFCKWVPLDARRGAAALKLASVDTPSSEFNAHVAVESALRSTTIEAPVYRPDRRPAHLGVAAGSACAIGGVAVLAWVALGHREHLYPASHLKHDDVAVVSPATRTAAKNKPYFSDASAKVRRTTPTRLEARQPVEKTPAMPASKSASRDDTIAHRHNAPTLAEKPRTAARLGIERKVSGNNTLPRTATTHRDRSRNAVPPIAQRTSPTPSVAGDYSPFAPAELGLDEYASMTTSAATHLRDIAPVARTGGATNLPDADGTEWATRMSQRRVTDVPEQFSK